VNKVWETTFPLDCAGSEQNKKKQMVYVKMNIIANNQETYQVLKTDDKMSTAVGTKQERGNGKEIK